MIFNRVLLKNEAKGIIQGKILKMFFACLVLMMMSAGFVSINFDVEKSQAILYLFGTVGYYIDYNRALQMALPVSVLGLLWLVFIGLPSQVSNARYFLNSAKQEERFSDVFSAFKINYGHNISVMVSTNFIIFLWTLLLIIPGIIKSIEYMFVPYIVAEHPEFTSSEARQLSSIMTKGYKWDLFVLQLSFILWMILGAFINIFTFGLGSNIITPYVEQTFERTYNQFKEFRAEEMY